MRLRRATTGDSDHEPNAEPSATAEPLPSATAAAVGAAIAAALAAAALAAAAIAAAIATATLTAAIASRGGRPRLHQIPPTTLASWGGDGATTRGAGPREDPLKVCRRGGAQQVGALAG